MKDDFLDSMFVRVSRMHRALAIVSFAGMGLAHGQPPVLFMLWDRDGRTQKEIAGEMHLRPASVTVLLQRMEKAGLLERRTDTRDQRVTRVYLTGKSRNLKPEIDKVLEYMERTTFLGFNEEEKALMRSFLQRMGDNLAKAGTCPGPGDQTNSHIGTRRSCRSYPVESNE